MKHFYSNLKLMLIAFFAFMGMGVWADEVTDLLNRDVTGVIGTSYAEFSEKTVNSAAVYAGQCAGGNESIQLRSNNSNSGVITTESGGTVKKIVVTWNSNTAAARELSIYGSNTAYTAATDLYDTEKQGTLIANLLCSDATEGVSTLEISDEYAFIGFRSKSGALYLTSVEITWEEGTVVPPAVAKPVITPNGGTFINQTTATITCETEGATIYYSMNGADPATDGSSPMYGRPLPISETLTLKAIAVKDEAVSAVASATFTQIPSYSTIAQLTALENNATFAFTGEALVVAKPTAKYVYIHDNSGNSLIYDSTGEKTADVEVGKTIAANWTGKVSIFRNLFELVPDNAIVVTDDPALPISYPADPISESNINQVVTLKNITSFSASGKNISIIIDGEKELQEAYGAAGYNQFGIEIPEAEEGKTYEMVGAVGRYNDNIQFWPITIQEAKEPEPEPELDFYVAGTMNEWKVDEAYKMTLNEELVEQGIKEFSLTATLKAGDKFKVVSSTDGETIKTYFPSGEDDNYVVEADGEYIIYCRPNFDGDDNWFQKCIKAELVKDATQIAYEAALAAIEDGGNYRIVTEANGTKFYVTEDGKLTSAVENGGIFTFTKKENSGGYKQYGYLIDSGTKRFTNPPLQDDVANLNPGSFATSTNNRAGWETQVLFLVGGKYAIRSCNVPDGTSSWNDAGRTYWTWGIENVDEDVLPRYTYDPTYVWQLEAVVPINVTYELYDAGGDVMIASVTKKQEANSEISIPAEWTTNFAYQFEADGEIGAEDCTIEVERSFKPGVVHALDDLSNTKAYTIHCDRGALLTKDGFLASTAHRTLTDAAAAAFAVIYYDDTDDETDNGHFYLYSVADQKFVTNTGALSEMPTHGVEDAIVMTAQTDPYFLYNFNTANSYLNTNGNDPYGYVINQYSTPDAGNQYYMIATSDFVPTAALAALEAYFHPSYFVTYVVNDAQGNVLFTSEAVPTQKGAKITTLPTDFQRPFTTYNEVDVTIADTETTVEFIATTTFPFEVSTSFDEAKWYNMTIRTNYYVAMDETEPYYPKADKDLTAAASQWAFTGDAYNGIVLWNKAAGEGFALTKDGSNVVMREGAYAWEIFANNDGFVLREKGSDNNWINQNGGSNGPLQFWNSANGKTDDGSTFRVSEVVIPEVLFSVLPNIESGVQEEAGESTGFTNVELGTEFKLTITAENLEVNGLNPDDLTISINMVMEAAFDSPAWAMGNDEETGLPHSTRYVAQGLSFSYAEEITLEDVVFGEDYPYIQNINIVGISLMNGDEVVATIAEPVAVRFLVVTKDGIPVGIKSLNSALQNADIYDMAGRKVQKVQRGNVYIINGKKVAVK